ncbi:MAG: cupin domain-containing protein [Candidatus Bathyarchaeota archaeon]|nr:cupin domain-containing protein [Candidatus Bathyarchaeota archaeon]
MHPQKVVEIGILVYVPSVDKVRKYSLKKEGVRRVKVKYLLHKDVGAKRLQLRLFTIEVRGYTPLEKHAHEHEVYMLKGKALVKGGSKEVPVTQGSVTFIPSNEEHQFKNVGNEKVEFLCTKETFQH